MNKSLLDVLSNCRLVSYVVAALIGILVWVLSYVSFGWHFFLALVLAVLAGGAAAVLLPKYFCSDAPTAPAVEKSDAPTADTKTPQAQPALAEPKTPTDPAPKTSRPAQVGAVRTGTLLAGEQDLAARKGSWRYQPVDKDGIPDLDGDGQLEGRDEGEKPATLTQPRAGGADNLKEIKGVGPKMEEMLNGMGFYHFDQIAAWTDQEVAWVDANLEGFKGRVSRDGWVSQAKILAAGGETAFSRRVEEGDVYD